MCLFTFQIHLSPSHFPVSYVRKMKANKRPLFAFTLSGVRSQTRG
uniref:Uncharacterized protein n=1 Tax=Anguilla anguilla TaxID=7936 RepID=A0A0E9T796_ANGAN